MHGADQGRIRGRAWIALMPSHEDRPRTLHLYGIRHLEGSANISRLDNTLGCTACRLGLLRPPCPYSFLPAHRAPSLSRSHVASPAPLRGRIPHRAPPTPAKHAHSSSLCCCCWPGDSDCNFHTRQCLLLDIQGQGRIYRELELPYWHCYGHHRKCPHLLRPEHAALCAHPAGQGMAGEGAATEEKEWLVYKFGKTPQ